MKKFVGIFLIGCLVGAARGDEVEQAYQAAVELSRTAEAYSTHEIAKVAFQQAIAKCNLATQSRPDYFGPQALAAHCYHRLAQLTPMTDGGAELIKSARERFTLAGLCAGANGAFYREWGGMLVEQSEQGRNVPEKEAMLTEARGVYQAGLGAVKDSTERAWLEGDLGRSFVLQAEVSNDEEDKRALCAQGLDHFSTAAKVEGMTNAADFCAQWGVATAKSARLTGNRGLWHPAVERLETSLQKGMQSLEVHYQLCCAYAVLQQPELAMAHLRICVNNDDNQRRYFHQAANDPDLRSLEKLPAYEALFSEKQTASQTGFIRPALSDR